MSPGSSFSGISHHNFCSYWVTDTGPYLCFPGVVDHISLRLQSKPDLTKITVALPVMLEVFKKVVFLLKIFCAIPWQLLLCLFYPWEKCNQINLSNVLEIAHIWVLLCSGYSLFPSIKSSILCCVETDFEEKSNFNLAHQIRRYIENKCDHLLE